MQKDVKIRHKDKKFSKIAFQTSAVAFNSDV